MARTPSTSAATHLLPANLRRPRETTQVGTMRENAEGKDSRSDNIRRMRQYSLAINPLKKQNSTFIVSKGLNMLLSRVVFIF